MKDNIIRFKSFGQSFTLIPRIELYTVKDYMGKSKPALAVVLDDACTLEQFSVLTVSFGEFIGIKNASYIDDNNNPPELLDAFLKSGCAMKTRFIKHSGFHEYPLWIFDEEWLSQIGGENYRKYSKSYLMP